MYNILILVILPVISSTGIPPNCTIFHNRSKNHPLPEMWTCPEGSPIIQRQDLCNNFFDCRRSLGDEKICIDYGPLGSSNITVVDEKIPIGRQAVPLVPRIFIPQLDCSAPLCVRETVDPELYYKAHLICRQTGRSTFQRLALLKNDDWSVAVSPDSFPCLGHEETVQQCGAGRTIPSLIDNCSTLLALSCANECSKEIIVDSMNSSHTGNTDIHYAPESGILTSRGYPKYYLFHLDCAWTLSTPSKQRLFFLEIRVLNLQEFDDGTSAEVDESACMNSYIELGLGTNENGNYVKHRMCREDDAGKNFTSFGNRIYVRYIAGQYRGNIIGQKGFALAYRLIDDIIEDKEDAPEPALSAPMISLMAFGCIVFVAGLFLGIIYCFNKSRYRARRMAEERHIDLVRRARTRGNLPLLRAPDAAGRFTPPVSCSSCGILIHHTGELCDHYARLLAYVTDNNYILPARRSVKPAQSCPINHASNITIDIEELLRADSELRKQQKKWRSMDISCISTSIKTAIQYDGSLSSYTALVDSDHQKSLERLAPKPERRSRSLSPLQRNSQSSARKNHPPTVRGFLSATTDRTDKLSIPRWSPRHTSTPEMKCPIISVGEVDDEPSELFYTPRSVSHISSIYSLSVTPTVFHVS